MCVSIKQWAVNPRMSKRPLLVCGITDGDQMEATSSNTPLTQLTWGGKKKLDTPN